MNWKPVSEKVESNFTHKVLLWGTHKKPDRNGHHETYREGYWLHGRLKADVYDPGFTPTHYCEITPPGESLPEPPEQAEGWNPPRIVSRDMKDAMSPLFDIPELSGVPFMFWTCPECPNSKVTWQTIASDPGGVKHIATCETCGRTNQ